MPPGQPSKEVIEEKHKNSNRFIVFLLATVLLLSAGGAYLFLINGNKHDAAAAGKSNSRTSIDKFTLSPIVVNLSDPGLRRYLRANITLEYSEPRLTAELNNKTYRIRDTVISVLRSKNTQDLQGEEALKQELVTAINAKLQSGQIDGLYFEEFLIQ